MNSSGSDDFDLQSLRDAAWLATQLPPRAAAGKAADTPIEAKVAPEKPPSIDLRIEAAEGASAEITLQTTQPRSRPAPVPGPTAAPLYPLSAATGSDAATGRLAALPALQATAALKLALRPLLVRQPQASGRLDETATVEEYLRSGLRELTPMYEPAPRRWLRLSLIAETAPSSALWTQKLDEFDQLLHSQGVFRLLRRWELRVAAAPRQEAAPSAQSEKPHAQLRALDRRGQAVRRWNDASQAAWWPQEILVVASDFTSAHWRDGTLPALLQGWGATQPVLLLQLLPASLWTRSWTGEPDAQVQAPRTAAPAATWLGSSRAEEFATPEPGPGFCLPLTALEPEGLANWVRAATGVAPAAAIGLRRRLPTLDARIAGSNVSEAAAANAQAAADNVADADGSAGAGIASGTSKQIAASPRDPDPAQRLARFRGISSPLAYRLARLLAVAAPLNFPVMRWVQRALLPQSDEAHLAEFFLGGLLQRASAAADEVPADTVRYAFLPGLRELLQQGLPVNHGFEVLRQVGAHLKRHGERLKDRRTAVTAGIFEQQEQQLAQDNAAFALVSGEFLALVLGETQASQVSPLPAEDDTAASTDDQDPSSSVAAAATPVESPTLELSSPAIDLQWSPDQDSLALLKLDGAALWHPSFGPNAVWPLPAKPATYPPPLQLLWYAHENGMREEEQLSLVNMCVGRIARALGMNGWQPLSVKRLTGKEESDPEPGHCVVLLFEHPFTATGISDPERWTIEQLLTSRSALCISIRLRHRDDRFFTRARYNVELERLDGGPNVLSKLAAELGKAVRWVRDAAYREWGQKFFSREGATALCWHHNGDLVTAEQDHVSAHLYSYKRSMLRAIVDQSQKARDATSGILPLVFQNLFATPLLSNGGESPPAILQLKAVHTSRLGGSATGIAWADDSGKVGVHNVPPQDGIRRDGSGLSHLLVPVEETDAWAYTHNGFGISLYRMEDGEQQILHLNLTAQRSRPTPESRGFNNSIVAAWINRDLAYVITEQGDLYSEIPLSAFHSGPEFGIEPQLLHKLPYRPVAVATCPRLNHFAMVSSEGQVALWTANGPRELARWQLPSYAIAEGSPRMALTSDSSKLAIATGTAVFILRFWGTGRDFSLVSVKA